MARLGVDQQRHLVACRVEEDARASHLWVVSLLAGVVETARLQQAWREIWNRHDVLRMHLLDENEEAEIHFASKEECPVLLIGAAPEGIGRWAEEVVGRRFDLTQPWSRLEVAQISEATHGLVLVLPRAALDERSLQLIFREFVECYGRANTLPTPGEKGIREYLESSTSEVAAESALRKACSALEGELPSLDLPSKSGTRPSVFSGRGRTISRSVDDSVLATLEELGSSLELTLEEIGLALFVTVLQRYSNQSDFTIGVLFPFRHWSGVAPDETRCVLRVPILPETQWLDAADQIARSYRQAKSMVSVPFQELVQAVKAPRDPSRTALYQAAFEMSEAGLAPIESGGVVFSEQLLEETGAAVDLTLRMRRTIDGVKVFLEYATDIIAEDTARAILASYHVGMSLLRDNVRGQFGALPLMDAAERKRSFFPLQFVEFDASLPVFRKLGDYARSQPDAVAAVMNGSVLTYSQLDQASNRLAHRLRRHGVREDTLVGVYCERSLDMLVAILGIQKAGGAYVPLDPKHPASRVEAIIEDAGPQVLVTQKSLRSSCPGPKNVILVEADDATLLDESKDAPALDFNPDALAYVIFTSGSTGRPKGVEISHRAFTNFVVSMAASPGMTNADRILSVTTLSFDIAGLELMLPLFVGGSIEIADYSTCIDAEKLKSRLSDPANTLFQATPATFRMLVESSWVGDKGLKVLCGGEAFPPDLVRSLLDRVREVWNVYGPTETTVWSSLRLLTDDKIPIPIGRPLMNTSIYLLNSCQQLVPQGAVGEIWIGGEGVARGYRGQPDLTAERFVIDRFSDRRGARMYRTGDLGMLSPNGDLICLGRVDFQVKIRGFRIELGDIESALLGLAEVSQAVVVTRDDATGEKKLVAYVVAAHKTAELREYLLESLRGSLPGYMVPATFVFLDALPLNPSGKIDRKALPEAEPTPATSEGEESAASNDTEAAIRSIFIELLGTTHFSMDDSFFDIGGNSLLAVRLLREVEKVIGAKLSLALLFETSSVRGIARSIGQDVFDSNRPRIVNLRKGTTDKGIFCIYGVALYQHLARALPKEFGVYGVFVPVEAKIFDAERLQRGELEFPSVSELAHIYLDAIRAKQSHGPYHIVGISFGGVVAYEAARILQSQGEKVCLLGLLDALLPGAVQTGPVRRLARGLWEFGGSRVGWQALSKLLSGRLRLSSKGNFNEDELEWLRDRIHTVQVHRYERKHPSYAGDVVLVHAGDRGDYRKGVEVDAAAGWKTWVTGALHEYVVPGRHLAIVQPPQVEILAKNLSAHLGDFGHESS